MGSQTRELIYNRAGANEGELIFSYTIQVGDSDLDGVQLAGSIDLNSGSIEDAADNPSGSGGSVALAMVTGLENVNVNTPLAVSITSHPNINISNQTTYEVRGNCSESGENVAVVLTDSGSGSITVSPVPTCNLGTWSSGQINTSSLTEPLADGDITITVNHMDSGSNSAPEQTVMVLKDIVAPTVSSVTIPAANTYTTGDLEFTVVFNEAVTIDTTMGTPSIDLTVGSQTRELIYNRAGGQ